jgi:integrase
VRRRLSDQGVKNLKPRPSRYSKPDPELTGHYVRVAPSGAKSFVVVARKPDGTQVWTTLGPADHLTIDDARAKARDASRRIRAGLPAVADSPTPEMFKAVAENYVKRHVDAKRLRSKSEIERVLATYVYPAWARRDFTTIRRSDIARLLDAVEDGHGARQADYVLAVVRGIANWFALRHDDYVSPFTRGMRRSDPNARTRDRVLDDGEIRVVWDHAESSGTFGAIIRLALLTAQRREKIATMQWSDITADGEWRIQTEEREKGTAGILPLPEQAIAIIRAQSRVGENPFIFPGRADWHFNGFSPCKRRFDATVKIAPWRIHDLRRTARSLMSRAGVPKDVSERVLGHAIPGVEGVYDRHTYRDEKADALVRLASLIDRILAAPAANLVVVECAKR